MEDADIKNLLQVKKTVHLELSATTHDELRGILYRSGNLSLNAIFNELAERIVMGDAYMTELLESLRVKRIYQKTKFTKKDMDDLFVILERESPLMREKGETK
jgi:hypothetical protein